MIIRVSEQFVASAATFATSLVALRCFDAQSLSMFFLLICGSQIAVVLLAARRISTFIRSPKKFSHLYLVGPVPIIEVILASFLVAFTSLVLLHQSYDVFNFSWLIILEFVVLTMAQLLTEWLRRVSAVMFKQRLSPTFLIAQFFRMTGPLIILILSINTIYNPSILIGFLIVSTLIAAVTYLYGFHILIDRLSPISETYNVNAEGEHTLDKRTLLEVYQILSWSNIPIALLAIISGSHGITRLVEVRTPLSFFNPVIEFIEVHIRRFKPSGLEHHGVWVKISGLIGVWLVATLIIFLFGDLLASLTAGRVVSDVAQDLVIFWWLQFILIVDRLTHNAERNQILTNVEIAPNLVMGVLLTLVTLLLIWRFNVTGCIIAMFIWCVMNVLIRYLNNQKGRLNGT